MTIVSAILNVLLLSVIVFFFWKMENSSLKKYFWPAIFIKLASGICVGLVYTFYYDTGDTFNFFWDAVKLTELARDDFGAYLSFLWNSDSPVFLRQLIFGEPRSLFFVKIVSLISILTYDNYWLSSMYFSLVSFMGAWMLARRILLLLPDAHVAAVFSFLFFPSVVFWSSGVIKESIASAAIFFLAAFFISIWMQRKLRFPDFVIASLSLWILWKIKYYYVAIFLPVVIAVLVSRYLIVSFKVKKFGVACLIWLTVFVVPLFLITFFHPNFYLYRLTEVIVSSYEEFSALSEANDLIHYHDLHPEAGNLLINAPWALFSGFFRPFITEVSTVFQFFVSVENLLVLVLTVTGFSRLSHITRAENRLITLASVVYVVLLCVFLALSTPNFGTLVRYRVAYYPFFIFLVTYGNPAITWLFKSSKKF